MTSVQNHLPRSSGNKPFLVWILIGLFLSSCGIFKPIGPDTEKKPNREDTLKKARADKEKISKDTLPPNRIDSLKKIYPSVYRPGYRIAFFLPLFLGKEMEDGSSFSRISQLAQDFYMGALLAFDTLKSCNRDFRVYVYDTKGDPRRMEKLVAQLRSKPVDLIIGPLFSQNLPPLNEYARKNKITLVSPFTFERKAIKENPYFICSKPGKKDLVKQAAQFVNKRFRGYNLFLIRSYNATERYLANQFKKYLDSGLAKKMRKYSFPEEEWSRLSNKFKDLKKDSNLVFIPSENEVFVSAVFSALRRNKVKEITVLGMPKWLKFNNIEGKLMENLNMHFLSTYYVDYNNPETRAMFKAFRDKFYVEPNEYSISGYDLTFLYGKMLIRYGKYFQRKWYKNTYSMIHSTFNFKQKTLQNGWSNNYIHVLKFEEMKLKKVDIR